MRSFQAGGTKNHVLRITVFSLINCPHNLAVFYDKEYSKIINWLLKAFFSFEVWNREENVCKSYSLQNRPILNRNTDSSLATCMTEIFSIKRNQSKN